MTLTLWELRILLRALDIAAGRFESQARYYEKRPDRYGSRPIATSEEQAAAVHALQLKFSSLRPRHDRLEIA